MTGDSKIDKALLDLGASVNLLPYSVCQQLGQIARTLSLDSILRSTYQIIQRLRSLMLNLKLIKYSYQKVLRIRIETHD